MALESHAREPERRMKNEGKEAYPLQWPAGWKRSTYRSSSNFKVPEAFGRIRDKLLAEVRRMGGTSVVLSTNIPLTKDGLPYAKFAAPADPGVAIYFVRKGKAMALACDKWRTVAENVHALTLSIEAMRGLERWGSSEVMERSFTGFTALPPPMSEQVVRTWRAVFGFAELTTPTIEMVRERRKSLLFQYHPDLGDTPSDAKCQEVNRAFKEASQELA
jgi:hypothetical protein